MYRYYCVAALFSCLVVIQATASSPQSTVEKYFAAIEQSDHEALIEVVAESNAKRIGKSILYASRMFRQKGDTMFFEGVFERVPSEAEIASMTPMQAFAHYMCDSKPDEDKTEYETSRAILGVVTENDQLVHVVYRVEGIPSIGEKKRDVLSCIKRDGKWRVFVSQQVWEAYMNYMLQPGIARLSDGKAEESHAKSIEAESDPK